ncbi:MAG: hypothetical protein JSS99_13610 [Actinobacteria bacterium]|nr:hypothetical protein [Actinomycetota bacterium]
MAMLPPLSVELRTLVERAGISVVFPVHSPSGSARAGAHTSVRAGARTLSAFYIRYGAQQDDDDPRLEVVTLPRNRILSFSGGRPEDDAIEEYLDREARRELSARSLALGEGAAEHLETPLGELILMREDQLPEASPIAMLVDGEEHRASTVSFGAHAAVWSDLPAHDVAVIVYVHGWQAPYEFMMFDLSR